jgi:hypothetical protein
MPIESAKAMPVENARRRLRLAIMMVLCVPASRNL